MELAAVGVGQQICLVQQPVLSDVVDERVLVAVAVVAVLDLVVRRGDAPQADDLVIERSGVKVLVDPASLDLLAGSELDYTDELMGSHFAVRNPNAKSACGCGTSFSLD